jgi:hypothetical protein
VAVLTVFIGAFVSVVTTVVTVLYGPAVKDRIESRRAASQRSAEIISRYSEPLAYAAFDLQSRLYNIGRGNFMATSEIPPDYQRLNTLWVIGQFLAWTEIVRRDIQVIDLGDLRKTAALQGRLFDISGFMSTTSGSVDGFPRIFRGDQRAIGELMVIDRTVGDQKRSDCLGYADFTNRIRESNFRRPFTELVAAIDLWMKADPATDYSGGNRLVLVQRALIDLIDFLDPDWVRFPDPDKRGKMALPADYRGARPASWIAGFELRQDPTEIFNTWAADNGVPCGEDATDSAAVKSRPPSGRNRFHDSSLRGQMSPNPQRTWASLFLRARQRKCDVVLRKFTQSAMSGSSYWAELYLAAPGCPVDDTSVAVPEGKRAALTTAHNDILNDLLRRFDRPFYAKGRLKYAGGSK